MAVLYLVGETASAGFLEDKDEEPLVRYYPAVGLINHDLIITRPTQEAHVAIGLAYPETGVVAAVLNTGLITWTDEIPKGLLCIRLPEDQMHS